MPPTSIDGTDITGATIDGTDVQEITVDGQTVFTAGPAGAFDLTNRTKVASYDTGDNIQSHAFDDTGTILYTGVSDIREHALTTPFDINTASFVTTHSTPDPNEMAFSADGTILNLMDFRGDYFAFDLTTPFDVSTRQNQRQQATLGSEEGFSFNDNGTEIHICRVGAHRIEVYQLSTPYDSTTRGSLQYSFTTGFNGDLMDITYNNDGSKYYALYRNPSRLEQLSIPTPFDPRNPTLDTSKDGNELDDGVDDDQKTISWSNDGGLFHHTLFDSREIYQWEI